MKILWLLMLVCDGFQESFCYQLPGTTLPVPVPSKKELSIQQLLPCLKNKHLLQALVQCLARLANWWGFVQQSSSYRSPVANREHTCMCQAWPLRENHSLHSFHSRKGSDQWRVSSSHCWELKKLRHMKSCVMKILWLLMLVCDGFQESCRWQESRCLLRSWARVSWGLNNFRHAKRTNISPSLYASLANWMGLPAPIHIKHRTENAHACAKHDHCEKTILSTVSILAKESDQWRVSPWQCWKLTKLEFVRHLRPCVGKSLSCWCCCATGSQESYCYQLPGTTLPVPVPSKKELSIQQLLPCLKNKHLLQALVQCLARLANWWGFVQQSSSYRSPVANREHTCMCQAWPLRENHSLHSFHSRKGSDQWRVSPSHCWELKKLEFSRHMKPCVMKILWLLMLLCDGFQESCFYQESCSNPVHVDYP